MNILICERETENERGGGRKKDIYIYLYIYISKNNEPVCETHTLCSILIFRITIVEEICWWRFLVSVVDFQFPYPVPQPHEPTKTLRSLVNIRRDSVRFVKYASIHESFFPQVHWKLLIAPSVGLYLGSRTFYQKLQDEIKDICSFRLTKPCCYFHLT